MTTRRAFIAGTGAAACVLLDSARAQTGPPKRVAYLSAISAATGGPYIDRLRAGLRELGWIEGGNLRFDLRYAEGDVARWEPLTRELLALGPDVFVTTTDRTAMVAAKATKTVPIVFVAGALAVENGLVKSLAHPGGNVTGFSVLNLELEAKRMSLLKEALPGLKKVGVLLSSKATSGRTEEEDAPARALGLEVVRASANTPEEVAPALQALAQAGAQAVMDESASTASFTLGKRLGELAIENRLPMIGGGAYADSGILMAYGVNSAEPFKRLAPLVDRILKGAKPADIPVEQINVYDFVVNLRTARALGIQVPGIILLQATRVIE